MQQVQCFQLPKHELDLFCIIGQYHLNGYMIKPNNRLIFSLYVQRFVPWLTSYAVFINMPQCQWETDV